MRSHKICVITSHRAYDAPLLGAVGIDLHAIAEQARVLY
jgi:hypothetical protein